MGDDFLAVERGIRELHRLEADGRDESPDADAIRDALDGPWRALTDGERERLRDLSASLASGHAGPEDRP